MSLPRDETDCKGGKGKPKGALGALRYAPGLVQNPGSPNASREIKSPGRSAERSAPFARGHHVCLLWEVGDGFRFRSNALTDSLVLVELETWHDVDGSVSSLVPL